MQLFNRVQSGIFLLLAFALIYQGKNEMAMSLVILSKLCVMEDVT